MLTVGIGLLGDRPLPALARTAAAAERGGFDAVWVPDERFFRDAYATLTAVALATRSVRLGPCVTDAFVRHPALTAMAIGTLQELSGGRAVLGIGAGISGFTPLGITGRGTIQAIREGVQLIRSLLAGEAVELSGERFRFHGSLDFPTHTVPIFIAGRGPKILELAGEIADGVIIGALASPEGLRYARERITAGARRAGRSPAVIHQMMWLHTYVHEDGTRAQWAARRIILSVLQSSRTILPQIGVTMSTELAELVNRMPYGYHWQADEHVLRLIPSDLVAAFTAAGTPQMVAQRLLTLHEEGIDHVALRLWATDGQTPDEGMQLLIDHVLPRLQRVQHES